VTTLHPAYNRIDQTERFAIQYPLDLAQRYPAIRPMRGQQAISGTDVSNGVAFDMAHELAE